MVQGFAHRKPELPQHSLTLEMLRVITGSGAVLIKTDEAGIQSVGVRGLEIPTDGWGQLWVHFAPHDKTRFVSAR
ncbi:MAG: adenylate/guanylate cyclase protein, partial [Microvirga sp.]|nr:adenylate/guanylate cyclase protein [Microvirga sp.]